jgi:hypothetical protein
MNTNKGAFAMLDFKKKLLIYGAILAVLIVLFVVGVVVQAVSLEPQGEKIFAQLKTDAVEKITVTDKAGSLTVAREGASWKIALGAKTFDAAKTAVDSLLSGVAEVRKKNTASSNKDTWTTFNVDDANAVHIVLSGAGGTVLADCYFGKGGATSLSQYIRLPGGPDVIQIDSRIEKTTQLKEWVERRLFPEGFYVDDVERVLVKTNLVFNEQAQSLAQNLAYTLVPGEKNKEGYTTWKIQENDRLPVSPQKTSSFVSAVAGFNADDVVQEPEKLNLDMTRPIGSIAVRLKTGKTYTISLLAKTAADPNSFYIVNQDAKYIYTGNNWNLKGLFGSWQTLIDTEALLGAK